MAHAMGNVAVEVIETIGLIPHPNDASRPPIEPYISDVLPGLIAKYDWLGLILAVFDSDSGLSENPQPPSIHVFFDEESGVSGLPTSPEPFKSNGEAERWLESHWKQPRQDFNPSMLAPQMVIQAGDRHYLAVTAQLEKAQIGRLVKNEHWSADLGSLSEDTAEFQIIKAVATDYS